MQPWYSDYVYADLALMYTILRFTFLHLQTFQEWSKSSALSSAMLADNANSYEQYSSW